MPSHDARWGSRPHLPMRAIRLLASTIRARPRSSPKPSRFKSPLALPASNPLHNGPEGPKRLVPLVPEVLCEFARHQVRDAPRAAVTASSNGLCITRRYSTLEITIRRILGAPEVDHLGQGLHLTLALMNRLLALPYSSGWAPPWAAARCTPSGNCSYLHFAPVAPQRPATPRFTYWPGALRARRAIVVPGTSWEALGHIPLVNVRFLSVRDEDPVLCQPHIAGNARVHASPIASFMTADRSRRSMDNGDGIGTSFARQRSSPKPVATRSETALARFRDVLVPLCANGSGKVMYEAGEGRRSCYGPTMLLIAWPGRGDAYGPGKGRKGVSRCLRPHAARGYFRLRP